MDRQVCVIKTVAYRARTDRQTEARTDKKVKTEGPIILSNDIFYFKNMMIIGGSIINIARLHQTGATAPKVRIVRPHCAEGRAAIRCAEGAILLPKCAECAHNKYADVFFFLITHFLNYSESQLRSDCCATSTRRSR